MTTQIRTTGVELTREDRAYIKRRIDAKVRKFAQSVDEVSVRLADVNGPSGGVDKVCKARVLVPGLPKRDGRASAPVGPGGCGRHDGRDRACGAQDPRATPKRSAPRALAGPVGLSLGPRLGRSSESL